MTDVTLVYPYFRPSNDNSIFRFPPLGLGYIAACLQEDGFSVELVDCTFMGQEEALRKIRLSKPKIIGIQSVFSLKEKTFEFADLLRNEADLLVAGGPLPMTNPTEFLKHFDVVAIGEGERTMTDLARTHENGDLSSVKGIWFNASSKGQERFTGEREFIQDLDRIPFPAREFFDNRSYMSYYAKHFRYTTTSIMTSRGCPFSCDFCSRPVFGDKFRSRSAGNIVEEAALVRNLGYSRLWFADDCFTLNRKRIITVCNELIRQHVSIGWECLSRVDTIDREVARNMRKSGCIRVFFGIESGNDEILRVMRKQITTRQAAEAVRIMKQEGIQVGAFFILGYPGENQKTILDTVKFASSLPLDYLSFTLPYPIPGTPLFDRVKDKIFIDDWEEPKNFNLFKHKLMFNSSVSEAKLKLAIAKGMIQSEIRKFMGDSGYKLVGTPFEMATNVIYEFMR